jgi:hypothetical protein
MSRYEERLDAFVQGRRFARMSRPVRNRADSWCDACGSVQARVLFGVQEEASKAVYFVGEHCLQQLAERGAIVRRFLRLSAEEAYAARCEARADPEPVAPESAEEALPTNPSSGADWPDSLMAFLVLATPGRRQSPLVLPIGEGAAIQALDFLRDSPGLGKQFRDLGLGAMPTEITRTAQTEPDAAASRIAGRVKGSGPRKHSSVPGDPVGDSRGTESAPGAA